MATRAQRWLTTIPALADHQLRVHHARNQLVETPPAELAADLNEVCRLAEHAEDAAREVLLAFVPVLIDMEHLERVQAVRDEGLVGQLPSLVRLLRASTTEGHSRPIKGDADRAALNEAALHHDGRPLQLGERRALARRPTRANLRKLMSDPHPMVVCILLANPRITEDDVVWMAARRPAVPEAISEIAKSWVVRARVRRAVVLNPGCPTAVSVPMLGLLVRSELEDVAQAADVPPVVRATARELAELRPPLDGSWDPTELVH